MNTEHKMLPLAILAGALASGARYHCARDRSPQYPVSCVCPSQEFTFDTHCQGVEEMFCELHSCPPTAQCFTNGFVIECAEFANRDTIVPCANDLCEGAGVSGKCFLVYGVPRCCSRDATLCHNSYTNGPSQVYAPANAPAAKVPKTQSAAGTVAQQISLFGVGTQVISLDHKSTHRSNHDGIGSFSFTVPDNQQFPFKEQAPAEPISSTLAMSAMSIGALSFGILFFIVIMVLLIFGVHTWSCTLARYDSWDESDSGQQKNDVQLESSADDNLDSLNVEAPMSPHQKAQFRRDKYNIEVDDYEERRLYELEQQQQYNVYQQHLPTSLSTQLISNQTTETQLTPSTPGAVDLTCTVEVHEHMVAPTPLRMKSPLPKVGSYMEQATLLNKNSTFGHPNHRQKADERRKYLS